MREYKYFSRADFEDSKIIRVPCSIDDMNPSTLERFDRAREISGIAYKVSCAARTFEHEISKNRNGTTAHLVDHQNGILCRALDIVATDSRERFLIINGLIRAGFTRIGVYQDKKFIHADDSCLDHHAQEVLW